MAADATIVPLRSDTSKHTSRPSSGRHAPAMRRNSRADQPQQCAPQQPPMRELPAPPAERAADAAMPAKSGRRRWLRWSCSRCCRSR